VKYRIKTGGYTASANRRLRTDRHPLLRQNARIWRLKSFQLIVRKMEANLLDFGHARLLILA